MLIYLNVIFTQSFHSKNILLFKAEFKKKQNFPLKNPFPNTRLLLEFDCSRCTNKNETFLVLYEIKTGQIPVMCQKASRLLLLQAPIPESNRKFDRLFSSKKRSTQVESISHRFEFTYEQKKFVRVKFRSSSYHQMILAIFKSFQYSQRTTFVAEDKRKIEFCFRAAPRD